MKDWKRHGNFCMIGGYTGATLGIHLAIPSSRAGGSTSTQSNFRVSQNGYRGVDMNVKKIYIYIYIYVLYLG